MTAPDLIERHVTAFLERIKADTKLAGIVFEGRVTGDPDKYVNVFHDTGFFRPVSLVHEHQDVDVTFTVHSVGKDRWQATWVDGRVLAALNDVVLRVPGRRCFKLQPAGMQPVGEDDSVQLSVFLAVRRFILHSVPAREP